MGRFFRSILAVLTLGSLIGSAAAQQPMDGEYIINSGLAAGARSFKTFGDAVAALTANGVSMPVVFNVVAGSGPYNEQIFIPYINGTSSVNTVTFKCNDVRLTFRSTDVTQQAGVKLDGARHIIFERLTVEPDVTKYEGLWDVDGDGGITNEYGTGFHLLRNADSNIVRKCTVVNKYVAPLGFPEPQNINGICINGNDEPAGKGISSCDDNILSDNIVIGGHYGIAVSSFEGVYPVVSWGQNRTRIINNVVKDYANTGILIMQCNETVVQGNEILSGRYRGLGYGIWLVEGNSNNRIIGNRIHGIRKVNPYDEFTNFIGIGLSNNAGTAAMPMVVANNAMYDIEVDGFFYGISISGTQPAYGSSSFVNVFHNTISPGKGGTEDNRGIYIESSYSTGVNILNNIIAFKGLAGKSSALLEIPKPITGIALSRNDYYYDIAGSVLVRYGNNSYKSVDSWQAATGLDAQSVSVDPLFVNYNSGDLKPSRSELDGRAKFVDVDKDILNVVRSISAPDVGAYEFSAPPCIAPVIAGTAGVVPGIICENSIAGLDLTGNTNGDGQRFQWLSSPAENGIYTTVGAAQSTPALDVTGTATLYYKVQVTCGTDTKTSPPVLLIVNPTLPRGAYTINAGQPYGNGNFRSFAEALQSLSCGISGPVVFNVVKGSGPYNEQVIVPAVKGASAINTITFNGNGEILYTGATTEAERGVVMLNNTAHVVFRDLFIRADASKNAVGVLAWNNTDSCSIIGCIIQVKGTSGSTAGVALSGAPNMEPLYSASDALDCDDILINGCTISGGNYGIICFAPSTMPVYRNKFTNNRITDFNQYGVWIRGAKNVEITGNDISRPNMTTASEAPYGILASNMTPGVIAGNKVHDLARSMSGSTTELRGIQIEDSDAPSTTPNRIYNNVIYGFTGKGVYYGIYNNGCDNSYIYHNTITFEDPVLVSRANYGIRIGSVTGVQVKNNIVTLKRNTSSNSWAFYAPASGYVSDNNDFFVDASNAAIKTGRSGSTDCLTLANWKSISKQDAASVAIDPKFMDVAAGNLKPTENLLKSKGVGVQVIRDILRARRHLTRPDVGAYEFACENSSATLDKDSIAVCTGGAATFTVKDPVATNIYEWYSAPASDELLTTGVEYTTPGTDHSTSYYMETTDVNGCGSGLRVGAKVQVLEKLQPPLVLKADLITGESVRFAWNVVPGAKGYQVSRNHINFTSPSPDPNGVTHTINGLKGGDTLSLVVKATADMECQAIISDTAFVRTLAYVYFVPNMFSPNGDGKNDEFRVYGNTISSMKLLVFNQWGQKVFETGDKNSGWNGTFNGQPAPVGVYMYVAQISFMNQTVQTAKGSIALVR